jgi:hypothetical protein
MATMPCNISSAHKKISACGKEYCGASMSFLFVECFYSSMLCCTYGECVPHLEREEVVSMAPTQSNLYICCGRSRVGVRSDGWQYIGWVIPEGGAYFCQLYIICVFPHPLICRLARRGRMSWPHNSKLNNQSGHFSQYTRHCNPLQQLRALRM